jgi:hypothetical protein
VWKWVCGPEIGTQFWQGGIDGSPVDGNFTNWDSEQPDNASSGEHYLDFWNGDHWNDYPNVATGSIAGYVVEYGGMTGDQSVHISDVATVVISYAPLAPTGISGTSTICNGSSTQLTASGAVGTVYWYTGSCGGSSVTTGNPVTVSPTTNTTYYAQNYNNSQFSAGCASIAIIVNPRPTVADLQATGTGIKWYLSSSGGTALATTTLLVNNTHYWASQTINGVESTNRFEVVVSITNP